MTHFDTVLVMKNINKFLLVGVLLLTVDSAWAQRRSRSTYGGSTSSSGYGSPSSTPVETTMASDSTYGGSSYSGGGSKWAVGLQSSYMLFRTNDTFFTGVFNINDKMAVQASFYTHKDQSTDKNGIGGLFKYTVSGNASMGFHVGGGLSFGKHGNNLSFTHIIGDAGVHFPIHSRVVLHVDGGLLIPNDEVSATQKDTGTSIEGASSVYGISILYTL
jgi:hypothetical protein